jgi:hypothetical protein
MDGPSSDPYPSPVGFGSWLPKPNVSRRVTSLTSPQTCRVTLTESCESLFGAVLSVTRSGEFPPRLIGYIPH